MREVNDAENVSERVAFAKALVKRGLFQEADNLLAEVIATSSATLLEVSNWILIASIQGHHAIALQRLDAAKAAAPGANWQELELTILLAARRFHQSISILQCQLQRHEAAGTAQRRLSHVSSLMEIDKAFGSDLNSIPDYAGYCINLDEYDQKWKRCQIEGASANLGFTRIPGIRGSYLPDSILPNLGEGVSDKFKGTLGCFLSHLRAWELFLKSKKDYALVVEDDFRPMVRFPSTIASLGLPDSFDVCWISERMDLSEPGSLVFKDIRHAVRKRASPNWWACGAEGYIISRSGAIKLKQYVQEDGLLGDVDWRMLTYSMERDEILRLPEQSFARMAMAALLRTMKPRTPLSSYSASIGLIGLVRTGSSRLTQNFGSHVHESI